MTIDEPTTLLARARSEYLEMPGLRLTPWQAGRLWNIEPEQSEHVLGLLVASGFLWRNRKGAYVRRSSR